MSTLDMTAVARVPRYLLKGAEEHGLDRDELLRLSGLSLAELRDPDSRVPVGKLWSLWRVIVERIDDPFFGLHLATKLHAKEFGLIGYVAYYSRTLGEALHRIARYSRIVNELVVLRLIEAGRQTKLVTEPTPQFDALRHPLDLRMSWVVMLAREITRAEIVPVEVTFPYPKPTDPSEYQRVFGAPVKFGQAEAALVFRNEDLEREVVAADDTLSGYLDQLAEGVLESLSDSMSFRDRVRRAIWTELSSGKPSVRRIASHLGVSSRTLQRRLEEEGTTFAAELDSLRHEMATRLLQDRELAVYEVAFLLGYSEPSTFYRAFRRWKQVSPNEYRSSAV